MVFNSPMLHVLRVEMVINSPWMLSKNWLVQKQTTFGVNTPRSDEHRLKLMELMVFLLQKGVCDDIGITAARLSSYCCQANNSDAAEGFEQIIDFLSGSYIHYALTVNPHIYISCIKQFWNTAAVKRSGDVTRLQALVDKKKIMISEAVVHEILQLNDVEGVKFLIHTILQSLSAKRTSWNKFSTAMASVVICLSKGQKFNFSKYIFDSLVRNVDSSSKFYMYPRFIPLIIQNQVRDLSTHTTRFISPALTQKVFANMRRVGKGFSGVETPLFEGMLAVGQPAEEELVDEQVQVDDAAAAVEENVTEDIAHDIPSPLPHDIPCPSQEPSLPPQQQQSSPQAPPQDAEFPTQLQQVLNVCSDLSKRVENLENDNAAQKLEIVQLKARVKKLEKANKLKSSKLRRLRKVGASRRVESSDDMEDVFNQGRMITDMDMNEGIALVKDAEEDDSEVQEVVEVVTTAKLITKVVTTAALQVSAASITIPAASATISAAKPTIPAAVITVAETPKVKDKGKGILVETPKPVKKKDQIEMDAEYAKKLQEEINKDYEEFDENIRFLFKSREEMEAEDQEIIKSINETPAQKAAKRRKLSEEAQEAKDLRKRLEVVDDEDDDVFVDATPLASKVPVVDYQIVLIDNKPRFKIIRADETHQLYISFATLLKNFDREDLETLWRILLTSCGVHVITLSTVQLFLLVERSTQKFIDEIGELKAIFRHMLGAARVQIPENNLDNLDSLREEDGTSKTMDPQDLLVVLEISMVAKPLIFIRVKDLLSKGPPHTPSIKKHKFEQLNKIDFIDAGGRDFDSEEIENFLNDDSIPIGVENYVFNMEEDILFLEALLSEDPSLPSPMIPNQTKPSIKEPEHSFSMGYEPFSTTLVTNEVTESSTKNLVPIQRECEVTSDNGSESIEPVKDDSSFFTTFSNPLFDNDEINSDELESHVESNSIESTSNHDTTKIDNVDEFSGPLIPIYIAEEETIIREHADYINRMEMLFTINPRPHPPVNANTNVEFLPSLPIPVQDNDSQQEEIDIVINTDDVLPPCVENDDSDREVDAVDGLRVDNSITNSEHEFFESEESDFDNPSVPLPSSEPPDEELDFEIDFEDEISVVRNTIVKFECIDARVKFDVSNDENDDYSYFMFDKVFSFLSAESEDTIFDPVDACSNSCEMWKAIERLKQGETINVQDLETNLFWEFRKFTSLDGESLESYYSRFYKMMNELTRNQCKIARVANPLTLVAQQQQVYHPQTHPTHYNPHSSTRTQQAATRIRGKAIVNSPHPMYDQEPSMVDDDDETSKGKEIDKLMALISLWFKKIYKPTNNNLRTSSNTSHANQDNSPRIHRNAGYESQRSGNVARARETIGLSMVQKYGIQCYNYKEYGHVARECQKPKRVKDAAYHREKMLLCKQEEAGIQLNAEQADWKDDTDDESDDQELEAHYMYMAKI
nr:hypothetical protein [Tanacetum cinerariifolium]